MQTLYNAKLFINNPYSRSPKYLLTKMFHLQNRPQKNVRHGA